MQIKCKVINFSNQQVTSCVAAIGNFDGCHLGHQALIQKVKLLASQHQCASGIVTFWPPPRTFFQTKSPFQPIWRLSEKLRYFKQLGIDRVICCSFNQALAQTSAKSFIDLLAKHYIQTMIVGEGFRCGKNREGTVQDIRRWFLSGDTQVDIDVLSPVRSHGYVVSSTRVRAMLKQGAFDQANKLLGRNFTATVFDINKIETDSGDLVSFTYPQAIWVACNVGTTCYFSDYPTALMEVVSCQGQKIVTRQLTSSTLHIQSTRQNKIRFIGSSTSDIS
jgi:FAD synthase